MRASPEIQQQTLKQICIDEAEVAVLGLLLDLQLNPASVDANVFPMLSLADDLKRAIREQGLKGVHGRQLQTINAKNLGVTEKKAASERVFEKSFATASFFG